MSRYIRGPRLEINYDKGHLDVNSVTVFEREAEDTGLLWPDGTTVYRLDREPIGFIPLN